jgi:ATP adenylyltransferase
MEYIGGPREQGCIFCARPGQSDLRQALVVARTAESIVVLNRYPYANGHLMVAPRRHAADLTSLEEPAYRELMEVLRRSIAIIGEAFDCEGTNVGLNLGRAAGAGIADHLHWHIVPRWTGDVNFMPMLADVRVMPEHLLTVYDRLRPHFEEMESSLAAP